MAEAAEVTIREDDRVSLRLRTKLSFAMGGAAEGAAGGRILLRKLPQQQSPSSGDSA